MIFYMRKETPENPLDFINEVLLKYSEFSETDENLGKIAEDFRILTGALSVIYNEVSASEEYTVTRAVAGPGSRLRKAVELTGLPIMKNAWEIDSKIEKVFEQEGLVEFESLIDLSTSQIPRNILKNVISFFNVGKAYVLGLKSENKRLGNLVFIERKDQPVANKKYIEILGKHFLVLLIKSRNCQASFLNVLLDRLHSDKVGKQLVQAIYEATEQLPDLVYQLDDSGNIKFLNQAIERYGYYREELIGNSVLEIIHPEDREVAYWYLMERRKGKRKTVNKEVRIITGNKNTAFFRVDEKTTKTVHILKLQSEGLYKEGKDSDEFIGTIGIGRDITPEKELRSELGLQSEVFRIIAENTSTSIWLEQIDPPKIYYTNTAADKMFMFNQKKFCTFSDWVSLVHPEDTDRVTAFINQQKKSTTKTEIKYRLCHPEKGTLWICTKAYPVYNNDHCTDKRIYIGIDITEQEIIQQELKEDLKKEKSYNREINHRVKNNLFMIDSMLSMEISKLRENDFESREILNKCKGRIGSIGLVHSMLYEMVNQGKIEINSYLSRLSRTIVDSCSCDSGRPDLELLFSESFVMPAKNVTILGMITNELIINALKHALSDVSKGRIILSFRQEGPQTYFIEVSDNGTPLPETGKGKGTGLSLINEFMKQLNGRLEILNNNGIKTFRIIFQSDEIEKL